MRAALALAAVTMLLVGCIAAVASDRLPERLGLAARYPGDRGLANDPAVVFADDVETATGTTLPNGYASALRSVWNNRWDHAWGGVRITREPAQVHAGRQALELNMERPASLGTSKYFSPGHDRLFLRYYMKYDDAFPGAQHVGGGLVARAPGVPHATAGIKPDGISKFDALLDLWSEPKGPAPGRQVAYVYHMDQQHEWGEQFYPSGRTQPAINGARLFGPSFVPRTDVVPERGRWAAYELMVQANTPGQRDGRVAFWIDGRLAADFPNLSFRTAASLKLNRADLMLYQRSGDGLRRVWIDDVVVATSYIGPMVPPR